MIVFEVFTIFAGAWGWKSGVPFMAVMPGAFFCGLVGGGFLSVGIHVIRTGYMQRMVESYRFAERPIKFIADSLMVILGVGMSIAWPIGYSIQELAKLRGLG